jgi:hypothetical protein
MLQLSPNQQITATLFLQYLAPWIAISYGHPYYALIAAASTTATITWTVTGSLYDVERGLALTWSLADGWFWPPLVFVHGLLWLLRKTRPDEMPKWYLISTGASVLIAACL